MTSSSKKRLPLRKYLADRFIRRFALPTSRLVWLAAAGAPVTAAVSLLEASAGRFAFLIWNGLLLLFAAVDFLLLPRNRVFRADRIAPEQADIGKPFDVTVTIHADIPQSLRVSFTDDLPVSFGQATVHAEMNGRSLMLTYATTGAERGRYKLHHAFLLYSGGLGLVRKFIRLECPGEVNIYPDLSQVRGILQSTPSMLLLEGRKIFKKLSSGSDFDSIRDYVQGDDPRTVNWRATARTGKLMTSVLRPEKGKTVTLLIDCGRMMGIELDGQTKLDRTLEAALALAAVALKQGDQVALLAFAAGLKVYVPPDKGIAHLNRLVEASYDLQSEFVESNYGMALAYLLRVQKKRSFVAVFSDMENYLYHQDLAAYAHKLRRSHMLLLLSMQDPLLHRWAHAEAVNARTAFAQSVAHKFGRDRSQYAHEMALNGIQVLDVPADQYTLSAVNHYLDLKAKDAW
ncbi:DUF58 domain-containing protein [Paenibacillus sp. MBLB4367]|uniref:DUF58 domain-containing protein n=1 Tax=Paenibacillus sp. MBLB4367 TaxID=3384767 RepID=UPI00390840ED